MKHTKGPWKAEQHKSKLEIWSNSVKIAIVNQDHVLEETADDNANAQLIAAAPELLEVLESIYSCVVFNDGPEINLRKVEIDTISKAIKKARGE